MVTRYFTLFRAFTVEYATEVEPLLPRWMYNVGVCMVFANSAVNPFLYGLGNRSVRRAWLQSFRCWYSRRTDLDYFRRLGNADSKPTLFNYATTTFAGSVSVSGARTYVQLPSHRLASQGALRRNDRSISNCVDSSCAKDAADWLRQSRGSTAGAGRCSFQATSLASTDND